MYYIFGIRWYIRVLLTVVEVVVQLIFRKSHITMIVEHPVFKVRVLITSLRRNTKVPLEL